MTAQLAILQTAVNLVEAGCTVVPTRKDGGKAPAGKWKDYQTTPPTGQQIAHWFTTGGHTGIGIITGKASGNIEMSELEGRAVETGALTQIEELAINSGLAHLYDRITQGWSEQTPSGGIHWYYRITNGIVPGNTKLATDPTGLILAETRGEGGFVVVAPSHGNVHPTGNPWTIIHGGPATIANITWEEREAFHSLFRALGTTTNTDPQPTPNITDKRGNELRPGDHYNQTANWTDILTPHGWTIAYTANNVTYWVRPGKQPRDGISATTGRNDSDNLYVFSTSTVFTAEKAYSKFAAYALLEHNNNYTEAARALAKAGYGTPTPRTDITPLTQNLAHDPDNTTKTIHPTDTFDTDPDTSTWAPVDLTPYYNGTHTEITPIYLTRDDGAALLYPGRIHSFYGESESGKSWLAQIACAQALTASEPVVYIDFEADPQDIINRLTLLGVPQTTVTTHLRYIRPEGPRSPDDPHWQALLEQPASLVIIDGVTEALTMWGGETKDNDAITRWTRTFPRAIARATGAAVITVDHVTKDKETRGRFAIGGQAKLATIDGAAYLIEPIEALAPGMTGRLTIRVTKDRPGAIRKNAGMWRRSDRTQEAAIANIDATHTPMRWNIERPKSEAELAEAKRNGMDRNICEYIIAHEGTSWTKLKTSITGDEHAIRDRLNQLVTDGYITKSGGETNGKAMSLWTTERCRIEYAGQLRAVNDVI